MYYNKFTLKLWNRTAFFIFLLRYSLQIHILNLNFSAFFLLNCSALFNGNMYTSLICDRMTVSQCLRKTVLLWNYPTLVFEYYFTFPLISLFTFLYSSLLWWINHKVFIFYNSFSIHYYLVLKNYTMTGDQYQSSARIIL